MVENLKSKIIKLHLEGFSYNKISLLLKCAKSTISFHVNKYRNKLYVDVIKDKLAGMSYKDLLCKYDLSKDKLKKICRQNKINKPNNQIKKNDDKNLKKEVIEFYNESKSLRKTEKKFNLSRYTLRKFFIDDSMVNVRMNNSDEYRKKMKSKHVINWRKRKKIELVKHKGGKCERCGYEKCISALSFHHTNPEEKDFSISAKSYSFKKLKKEVDKCIMVCANCHIEIHEEIKNKLKGDQAHMDEQSAVK